MQGITVCTMQVHHFYCHREVSWVLYSAVMIKVRDLHTGTFMIPPLAYTFVSFSSPLSNYTNHIFADYFSKWTVPCSS